MTVYDLNASPVDEARTVENEAEIVGEVFAARRYASERGKPVARAGDSLRSAMMQQLHLHVVELHGVAYTIPIAVNLTTANVGLLLELRNGDRVRVGGMLTHEDGFDTRYISPEHPDGRPVREVRLRVNMLARAGDDDLDGSFVRLSGEITEPPLISMHESQSNLRVGRCKLRVVSRMPDRRGGEIVERHVVPLDVPVDLGGSGAALRSANRIEIQGYLDALSIRIAGDRLVSGEVEALRRDWAHRRGDLDAEERRSASREVARTIRGLAREQRLRVRVTRIRLLSGTPLDDEREVHHLRVSYLQSLRAQTRQRRLRSVGVAAAPAPVEPQPLPQPQPDEAPRPRRRRMAVVAEPVPQPVADAVDAALKISQGTGDQGVAE